MAKRSAARLFECGCPIQSAGLGGGRTDQSSFQSLVSGSLDEWHGSAVADRMHECSIAGASPVCRDYVAGA